ncbi:hypothetical protein M8J75_001611 [Diaphorina citri]|nr:hypothetical protein M8J75_001611 [Diaphorina citri]KAI5715284.1 hypothetical protein M8J77_013609 [Diaphorina citri]
MYYTLSLDAKEQVLANLGNFSYDPINYAYLRQLNVIDIYLDIMSDPNYNVSGTETLVHFALAGLCNLCLDKDNKEYILSVGGIKPVTSLLMNSNHEQTVLNSITTLMYLVTPQSKSEITSPEVIQRLLQLSAPSPSSSPPNPRAANLAKIFLNDLCTPDQIARASHCLHTSQIPLPC